MSWTMAYLVFSVLWLSAPGSVITANGWLGQITANVQVLERSEDWQCPSLEERERARNKIHQAVASAIATTLPTINVQVLERSEDWQCPSLEERERARNKIHQAVASAIAPTISILSTTTTATTMSTMTTTSATIIRTTISTVSTPTTAVVTTMPTITVCGTPGWRRVAFINMTDTSYNCPTGLNLTSYSKRTCGRSHTTFGGCSSTTFSVGGLPYSRVCGRIRGYQFGATNAFLYHSHGINSDYVDGVSLTHGGVGSRQHIWTFAAGISEVTTGWHTSSCPCDTSIYDSVPAFVGNDYFCESGLHSAWNLAIHRAFFPNDVLWDGEDCTSTSTCCQFNNPPWFTKNLTYATSDDIELRICTNGIPEYDDAPIELIELYVQ